MQRWEAQPVNWEPENILNEGRRIHSQNHSLKCIPVAFGHIGTKKVILLKCLSP